ncbi:sugar ABC transporter substrate-binding protein, partial [Thioclava sp. BHET1]
MKTLILASVLASAITGPAFADTTLKLVEVITSPQRTETLKSIVGTFEKQNPGTHVDIISLPWGEAFQKFATMVAAGNIPDVVEMPDTWLSLYANNHMLESLEPYLKDWKYTSDLSDRALELGRTVDKTAYMLPYGFYLNALFYNKKLLAQAGISAPPKTMDEFLADSKKISAIPGKYGYCLRGGSGGFNSWAEFGTNMAGSDAFFTQDGKSTMNDAGWVKGLTWLIDLYKDGYAPKDAVNWGFNETVAGFYSGTCAFLNQDPDALIGISSRMSPDDFGVTNFPAGPSGKAFPTIGYAGWSMMAKSAHKEEAW